MKKNELTLSENQPPLNIIDESVKLSPDQSDPNISLYGNPYYILYPRKLGNHYAFFFIGTYPLITIGPDSKNTQI